MELTAYVSVKFTMLQYPFSGTCLHTVTDTNQHISIALRLPFIKLPQYVVKFMFL